MSENSTLSPARRALEAARLEAANRQRVRDEYFNYAVSFSDGSAKTGITSKPFYRLQDFIQEAHRHAVKVNGFKITLPSDSKRIALDIENHICKMFDHITINGHREWFFDDLSWCSARMRKKLKKTANIFTDISSAMECQWELRNKKGFYLNVDDCPFHKMRQLAESLGADGDRISATKASAIAEKWRSEQESENSYRNMMRKIKFDPKLSAIPISQAVAVLAKAQSVVRSSNA